MINGHDTYLDSFFRITIRILDCHFTIFTIRGASLHPYPQVEARAEKCTIWGIRLNVLSELDWICLTTTHVLQDILWGIREMYHLRNQRNVPSEESEKCTIWGNWEMYLMRNQRTVLSEESEKCTIWGIREMNHMRNHRNVPSGESWISSR